MPGSNKALSRLVSDVLTSDEEFFGLEEVVCGRHNTATMASGFDVQHGMPVSVTSVSFGATVLHCEPEKRWQNIFNCDYNCVKTHSIFIIFALL